MAFRRIFYGIILLASVAAFIVTDSGVALFVMVCLLALPILSIIGLFIARYRVKLDFSARESCIRGGAIQLDIKVGVHPRFLLGFVKVVAEIENSTFGKTQYTPFTFNDLTYTPHTYEFVSEDSGRIRILMRNLKLIDIFGLFRLTVKCNKFAESFVSPMLYEDISVHIGVNNSNTISGEYSIPIRGQDPTEIFDIRDYAPGDSMKAVHWKLSGKFDSLKTKEFGCTDDHKTLVLVDLSRVRRYGDDATDEQMNAALDIAVSVSNALKKIGYTHSVGWFDDGTFYSREVVDSDSFVQMVDSLMSIKVDKGNSKAMFYLSRDPECAAFTKIIFVAAHVNIDDFKDYGGEAITALTVGTAEEAISAHGIRIIEIPIDNVSVALTDCVL